MKTHVRTRGGLVAALVVAITLVLAPVSSWADAADVSVDNVRPQLGDEITVTGNGFTKGDQVSFRVCGAPDKTGRLACAEGNESLEVAFDGSVRGPLKVEEPPGDCPCSVVVDSPNGPPVATPINLVGHPVAKTAKAPDLVVDAATLEPAGGLGRWFGAAPEATLTLTLRNAGVAPAEPTLDLVWRDGDDAPESIVDSGLPVVEPGESVDVEVPLTFGSFAQGEHTVSGQVVVGDLYSPVNASTSLGPWGLYILLLGGLAVGGYARTRSIAPKVNKSGSAPLRASGHKEDHRSSGHRVNVPAARQSDREPARAAEPAEPAAPVEPAAPARTPEPAAATVWEPSWERDRAARSESSAPEPAIFGGEGPGTYVGPPRLESTPLSPRPGAAQVMTLDSQRVESRAVESQDVESQGADAAVEAPRVPHQASAFPRQETVAPAQQGVTRSTTPEQDAATVANAMAIIRERSGSTPAHLPSNHEVAPTGKRAERGGKRAARPEKSRRITRR